MKKIVIGADIVPTDSNFELFRQGDARQLIGNELLTYLKNADFVMMNLEVPLTDKETPISKAGPNLLAPTETICGLKAINACFYTLANNHIMDQGIEGLNSTIKILKESNLAFAGVGKNIEEASKPYVTSIAGIKLGIYCCVEHEESCATEYDAGANPFDVLTSFDHVTELKRQCDLVVVLYHGGKEEYRYPSPMLQRVFRKFADAGADYVIAQHTHCIGCKEEYNAATLIYGQGNFLFEYSESEYWKTSLLVEICVDETTKEHCCSYIACQKYDNGVRIALESDVILEEFKRRSEEIEQPGFVQQNYSQYAYYVRKSYFARIAGGFGKIMPIRIVNKLISYKLFDWLYKGKYLLYLKNCFECEPHRELIIEMLREKERIDGK